MPTSKRELLKMWLVMGVSVFFHSLGFIGIDCGLEGHRSTFTTSQFEPMWVLNPWHHIDLASLFWVGPVDFSEQIIRLHPASLGLAAIVSSFGCRDWKWWTMFHNVCGFSLGPEVYWMGSFDWIQNPLHWIFEFDTGLFTAQSSWEMDADGDDLLDCDRCPRHEEIQYGVLDDSTYCIGMVFRDTHWNAPYGYATNQNITCFEPAEEMEISEETRLLQTIAGPGVVFQQALYEQTVHGIPLWMNPNRPNPSEWFQLTEQSQWIETIAFTKQLSKESCVPTAVGPVLVAEPYIELFVESWGNPTILDDRYALWKKAPKCHLIVKTST